MAMMMARLYAHPTAHTCSHVFRLTAPFWPCICSEANDMAMMMARLYTGSHDIITLRNAYHGLSGEGPWW